MSFGFWGAKLPSVLLLSVFFLASATASARVADPGDYEEGAIVKVDVYSMLSTQNTVGMLEVLIKVARIKNKWVEGKLKAYKKKNTGLAVIGPKQVLYLVDKNHFASAIIQSGHHTMYVEILKDLSGLSVAEFKKAMKKNGWLNPHEVFDGFKPISELKDDPYRTLSWLVRYSGGYDTLGNPYQEFAWANFFRTRLTWDTTTYEGWQWAVEEGARLAKTPEAKKLKLPGWNSQKPNCKEILLEVAQVFE